MGDRVAVLKDGLLQQVDTPRNMYDHPNNVFVAGFIGSPAMNLLKLPVNERAWSSADDRAGRARGAGRAPATSHGRRPARGPRISGSDQGIPVQVDVVEELGADAYIYGTTTSARRRHRRPDLRGEDARPRAATTSSPASTAAVPRPVARRCTSRREPGHVHLFDIDSGARLDA